MIVSFAPSFATLNGRPAALSAPSASKPSAYERRKVRGMMSDPKSAMSESKSLRVKRLPKSPPRKFSELDKQSG